MRIKAITYKLLWACFGQVLGFWSFTMMYKPVDIKTFRWCGKCWIDQNRIWWNTIPSASNGPSGGFFCGLTRMRHHPYLQIMLKIIWYNNNTVLMSSNITSDRLFTIKSPRRHSCGMVHSYCKGTKSVYYDKVVCKYNNILLNPQSTHSEIAYPVSRFAYQ